MYTAAIIAGARNAVCTWTLPAPSFDNDIWCAGDFGCAGDGGMGVGNCWNTTVFHLHMAAFNGEVRDLLLEIGRNNDNIDERCYFGATALHYACSANNPDAVRTLLRHGADPNAPWIVEGNLCKRILMFQAMTSFPRVAAPAFDRWTTPFAVAVTTGSAGCVRALLEHAAEQDARAARLERGRAIDEATPFFVAATSPRSRKTHFLPRDVLNIVWDFLRPAQYQPEHVREMTSCHVCDRLEYGLRPPALPTLVNASEVFRNLPEEDGIDGILSEFNVDRPDDEHHQ